VFASRSDADKIILLDIQGVRRSAVLAVVCLYVDRKAYTGVEIMVLFWGIVIDEEFMVPAITNRIGYDFGCRVI
jgi:hypothetical protein